MIHIGEHEQPVTVGHAQGLYSSLRLYLNIPVKLSVYPCEVDGLSHYRHLKAKMEWDNKWFDYYQLGIQE